MKKKAEPPPVARAAPVATPAAPAPPVPVVPPMPTVAAAKPPPQPPAPPVPVVPTMPPVAAAKPPPQPPAPPVPVAPTMPPVGAGKPAPQQPGPAAPAQLPPPVPTPQAPVNKKDEKIAQQPPANTGNLGVVLVKVPATTPPPAPVYPVPPPIAPPPPPPVALPTAAVAPPKEPPTNTNTQEQSSAPVSTEGQKQGRKKKSHNPLRRKNSTDVSGDGRKPAANLRRMASQTPKSAAPSSGAPASAGPSTGGPGGRKSNKSETNEQFYEMVGKALTEFTWYHGLMPRADCEELLKVNGDFLVRKTTMKKVTCYVVSVQHQDGVKHVPLEYKAGQWTLYQEPGEMLNVLIERLVKEGKSVGTGIVLKNPIPRPEYYLLHENITRIRKIGSGAFGEVHFGTIAQKDKSVQFAAIKMIKGSTKKPKMSAFIKEAKLMLRFNHPNIVRLYGVAPQEDPLMIVLEYAAGGDLRKFFKKHADVPNAQLVSFVTDAARGMCYLSLSQVIHRDLAARNCLLGDRNELKISDFGISVADVTELKLDHLKKVPIKWLSPESITQGVFTTKTDVWSFGVLIWEIFNKCKDPFPGETNAQAKVKILGDGLPMVLPENAPQVVKSVMETCFTRDPVKRSPFSDLLKDLSPDEEPPKPAPRDTSKK